MNLDKLSNDIRNIAILEETSSPIISCYIDHEAGRMGYRNTIDERVREIRRALPAEQRFDFEQALGKIEVFLAEGVDPVTKGLALFARGGETPFFHSLQFRVPLPNLMSVDSVPHIYELVALKDTYHRYVVLISCEAYARIIEVSVGEVTKALWTERPELRKRVGREWSREQYQSHRRDRTQKFIKEMIEILNRLVEEGEYSHLVLAGSTRMVADIQESLPKRLKDKLIDVVAVSGNASTSDIVSATLSSFSEHEETESMETADLFLDELRTGGLAVAGTEASLKALAQSQVDVLVMSDSYAIPTGWKCLSCKAVGVHAAPVGCPQCGERDISVVNIKEHMISVAELTGSTVEIVRNSDILLDVGGVGCLLRYLTPEQRSAVPNWPR